ncbi:MAG: AsmA family protein [Litorivicinaceae bacterium]
MRTLKYSALAVAFVLFTGIIGLALLTQWMSAERIKPLLIDVFADADIRLELPGELDWQLGSVITFELGALSASGQFGTLSSDSSTLKIPLSSLLRGSLVIDHASLVRPKITLSENRDPRQTTGPSRQFLLRALDIEDGQIAGLPGQLMLSRAQVRLEPLTPDYPSEVTLDAIAETPNLRFPIVARAEVRPSLNAQSLTLTNIRLQSRQADLQIDGYLTFARNGDIAGEGWLEMPNMQLRQWLSIAGVDLPSDPSQQSFRTFSLQGGYQIDAEGVRFEPLEGQLDDSPFQAQATWLFDRGFWNLVVDLETLAWPRATPDSVSGNPAGTPSGILPPNGQYAVRVKQLSIGSLPASRVQLAFGVDQDQITIGQLSAGLMYGELEASGLWVPTTGAMSWIGTYTNGSLAALPTPGQLAGQLNLQFDVEWTTGTEKRVIEMLTGSVRGAVKSASLQPFDPSLAWCEALQQPLSLNRRFKDELNFRVKLTEGVGAFDIVDGKVGGLQLSGSGRTSLVSGAMQTSLNTALSAEQSLIRCPLSKSVALSATVNCRMNIKQGQSSCLLDEASSAALVSQWNAMRQSEALSAQ